MVEQVVPQAPCNAFRSKGGKLASAYWLIRIVARVDFFKLMSSPLIRGLAVAPLRARADSGCVPCFSCNSLGFGAGTDASWVETNHGRPMPVNGVKGRYVRFYSCGRSLDDTNQYIEAEVYGK